MKFNKETEVLVQVQTNEGEAFFITINDEKSYSSENGTELVEAIKFIFEAGKKGLNLKIEEARHDFEEGTVTCI